VLAENVVEVMWVEAMPGAEAEIAGIRQGR